MLWVFNDNYNGISNGNGGGTLWGSTGLRIFSDNDNCNVNNNGISNSGEALRGSTGLLQFCKRNEELRGAAVCRVFLLWFKVLWYQDFTANCGFTTRGLFSVENPWAISTDYENQLLRFGSRLQYGVKVLSGSLSNILKGRYLLKKRKVIITSGRSLGSSRERVID